MLALGIPLPFALDEEWKPWIPAFAGMTKNDRPRALRHPGAPHDPGASHDPGAPRRPGDPRHPGAPRHQDAPRHPRAGGDPAQRARAWLAQWLLPWATLPRGLGTRTDLRIDVALRPEDLDTELDGLYRRLRTPGDPMFGIATVPTRLPGLVFRTREADGEYYVYVEDVARGRLAGYTVFNRLIELNRRADRHLRAPHSRYAAGYQRRGIASAVYESALDAGLCLISGARQSTGAHGLWLALARRHELLHVDVRDKSLRCLGPEVDDAVLDDLHTRMVLLGNGWTLERLCTATGMQAPAPCEPAPR